MLCVSGSFFSLKGLGTRLDDHTAHRTAEKDLLDRVDKLALVSSSRERSTRHHENWVGLKRLTHISSFIETSQNDRLNCNY